MNDSAIIETIQEKKKCMIFPQSVLLAIIVQLRIMGKAELSNGKIVTRAAKRPQEVSYEN